jgi:hypothetical protein
MENISLNTFVMVTDSMDREHPFRPQLYYKKRQSFPLIYEKSVKTDQGAVASDTIIIPSLYCIIRPKLCRSLFSWVVRYSTMLGMLSLLLPWTLLQMPNGHLGQMTQPPLLSLLEALRMVR